MLFIKNRLLLKHIFILILSFLLCPLSLSAKEYKRVRIAADDFGVMLKFDKDNQPISGYAYEYITQIAAYAGWDVEYIRTKDFADTMKKLKGNEADITCYAIYASERESVMLYPELPMGTDHFVLFAKKENADFYSSDFKNMNGKKIGITFNPTLNEILSTWLKKNKLQCDIIEYKDYRKKLKDVLEGKLDLDCNLGTFRTPEYLPVATIGNFDYYLATSPRRPDLLQDINVAQKILNDSDPFYLSRLAEKYFYKSNEAKVLSQNERHWVETHKTVRIGYPANFYPYSFVDPKTEKISGLVKDFTELFLRKLDLTDTIKIEFYPYTVATEAIQALLAKKIDLIFPFYKNALQASEKDLLVSKDINTIAMDVLYKVESGKSLQQILKNPAVVSFGIAKDFVLTNFPDSQILLYNSLEDCLKAIKNNECSCIVTTSNFIYDLLVEEPNFKAVDIQTPCTTAFIAHRDNITLLSIINKARSLTQLSELNRLEENYPIIHKENILSFLRSHYLSITFIFIAIVLSISFAFIMLFRVHKRLVFTSKLVLKQKEKLEASQALLYESLEEANAETERATKASNAKTDFLFNMSHDLRTPMNAILGFCRKAAKNIDYREITLNSLNQLEKSGEFLLLLLNEILDVSSMERGNINLTEKETDIILLFQSLEQMLSYMPIQKKIQLSFTVENIRNRHVFLDPVHVNKILINLITNAINYNKEGGWVQVFLTQSDKFYEDSPIYRFTIEDNGIGMSDEFQKHMFEDFAREKNSTQAGIQGAGMGLSICKKLVELMKGTISCSSTKNIGTLFTVEIPFKAIDEERPAENISEQGVFFDFSGNKCLIVEDNELNAEILADILEDEKVIVDTAENGEIAVQKLRQYGSEHYDFILMDIQMPVMNGYEATKSIRALYPDAHIPIIAVSANAFEEDIKKSLESGMNAHIAKPVNAELLFTTLERYLK